MATYTSIEERLLSAADASDLATVADIVSHLSTKEKESVRTVVFDAVLHSIARHAKVDGTESAYTMMVFIRAVGSYTSPVTINSILQSPSAPSAFRRRSTDLPLPAGSERQHAS